MSQQVRDDKDEGITRWELLRVYGTAVVVALVVLAATYQFVDPAPPRHIVMATGHPDGAYHAFGERYREVLGRQGIEVELRNTSGSIENIGLLEDPESGVSVGFVQGGTGRFAKGDSLRALGSLYYEPIWLVHRQFLPISRMDDLAGLRVAVGPEGSGTRAVALELLADNALAPPTVTISPETGSEAVAALEAGELDALFLVGGPASANVLAALRAQGLALLSFERAGAYVRHHRFLSQVSLPEGVLDIEANLPARDVTLISPAATLVVDEDVHKALIGLLLTAATEIHGGGGLLEEPGTFPSALFVDLPLSDTSKRYFKSGPPFLARVLPFWAATMIDRLAVMVVPLIAFMVPMFRFMPAVYRWRSRSRIYRWYKQLRPLEARVQGGIDGDEAKALLEDLDRIEAEARNVSVPWGYVDELYQLRTHINLVRNEVRRTRGGTRRRGDDSAGAVADGSEGKGEG
jgi:uncharacterized protein